MNYELALKLKEAGFPQKPSYLTSSFTKEDAIRAAKDLSEGNGILIPTSESYLPTLSELIAACGEEFGAILRVPTGKWQAMGGTLEESEHKGQGRYKKQFLGATPEEAVANLWLALNPKS